MPKLQALETMEERETAQEKCYSYISVTFPEEGNEGASLWFRWERDGREALVDERKSQRKKKEGRQSEEQDCSL